MIYIASPFFTDEQKKEVDIIESTCHSCRYEFFSPRKSPSSPYYSTLNIDDPNFELVKRLIFKDDIDGLDASDSIICNPTNLDSGTLFELGYAIAKGKKVIPAFNKHVELITTIQKCIAEKTKDLEKAYIVKVLGDTKLALFFENNDSREKYIIAESPDSSNRYLGLSKVLCGLYYALGYNVNFIDIPRKSNLMMTCSGSVYELNKETFEKLDKIIIETDNRNQIIDLIKSEGNQVFGRQDD